MKPASWICTFGLILSITQAPVRAQAPGGPPPPAGGMALYGEAGPHFEKAKSGDIRAYVTKALEQPLDSALMAQADKAVGKHVVISWGSARGNILDTMLAGNGDFEVAIVLPDVNQKALAAGKIKPRTYEIARTPIAFGVRGDASAVDMSTPEAVKRTLLAATSVKYAPTGAALLTVKKVLSDLQIGDKIKDNSKTAEDVALSGNQYEISIYPLSEAIPRLQSKTVTIGPVIKEFQVPSIVEASIGVNARDVAGAEALIKFLQGPATDAAFKAAGLEKDGKVASR
jgi:molybdate transport system substrate-binding protein